MLSSGRDPRDLTFSLFIDEKTEGERMSKCQDFKNHTVIFLNIWNGNPYFLNINMFLKEGSDQVCAKAYCEKELQLYLGEIVCFLT